MASYTFVIHGLSRGGAEKVLLTVAAGLKERGHQIRVVIFGNEIALNTQGLPVTQLNSSTKGAGLKSPLILWRLILKLRKALKERSDFVISFGDQNNLITAVAKLFLPGKLILSDRIYPLEGPLLGGRSQFLKRVLTILRNTTYAAADALVIPTEEMRAFYKHNKTIVIPNPIKTPNLSDLSNQNSPVIIAAGRLVPQKRFDLAIEAFSTLGPKDWELRIFGDGPLKDNLIGLAASCGGAKIAVNSATPQLSKEFSQASIFVLSSDFEGFPNVLLEAMAHGLAVIATRCPTGPSTLIKDGENGLLIPCGDRKALSDALDKLIRDAKFRKQLGMNAALTSREFSEEKIIAAWEAI